MGISLTSPTKMAHPIEYFVDSTNKIVVQVRLSVVSQLVAFNNKSQ